MCLEQGFGIEIDIRYSPDFGYYLSHHVRSAPATHSAEEIFVLIRQYPRAMVALNLKELGYEKELAEFRLTLPKDFRSGQEPGSRRCST